MAWLPSNNAAITIRNFLSGFTGGFRAQLRHYRALSKYYWTLRKTGDRAAAEQVIGPHLRWWESAHRELGSLPAEAQWGVRIGKYAATAAGLSALYAPFGLIHRYASGGSLFRDERGRRDVAFLPFF